MPGSPQSDDRALSERHRLTALDDPNAQSGGRADPPANLGERELEAALQLLVERAQYITGATGTALALPQGDEMVCRASAGACAPAVGARLQVRSGLTGESIARRQLLRCDNAETDPRVNLETCHALGIASIVVLPLLRRSGEVRGLFELFSDHPYAFEERDLVALERMAALTLTALDLAEQQHDSVAPAPTTKQPRVVATAAKPTADTAHSSIEPPTSQPPHLPAQANAGVVPTPVDTASAAPSSQTTEPLAIPSATPEAAPRATTSPIVPRIENAAPIAPAAIAAPAPTAPLVSTPASVAPIFSAADIETSPEAAPVPEAMRRVQKCVSCGFPVSEGRTLCLDCEGLERMKIESEKKAREKAMREAGQREVSPVAAEAEKTKNDEPSVLNPEGAGEDQPAELPAQGEILPRFLTDSQLVEESWLASHVNLLAFLVLIAAVLVAAVVFFR